METKIRTQSKSAEMSRARAEAARNISVAMALEIPSLAPDASKLAPAGSLGIIKSVMEHNAPAQLSLMKIFYHGSPTPDIKVLTPRLDPRLGITGVFVADEPFGPMMFALLPERLNAIVKYTVKDGNFVDGYVITPKINDSGWLYTVQAEDAIIGQRKPGRYHLTAPVSVIKAKKIMKEHVLAMGWR